jgi:S1-C subfamily serine protease
MTTTEAGTGAEERRAQGLSLLALNNAFSSGLGEMIEQAQTSVVQVRRGDRGAGTGVIWQTNGGIITNHHVIAHTGSKTLVELRDGQVFEAQIVDSDPTLDLALLKVPADHLTAIPVADSTKLRVGELVFAIGHPWGQRGVVTAGIVSALSKVKMRNINRQLPAELPTDIRHKLANEQTLGLLVVGIIAGGLAERANLLVGDVLIDIENTALSDAVILRAVLAQSSSKETVHLRVLRGGKVQEIEVTLHTREQAA